MEDQQATDLPRAAAAVAVDVSRGLRALAVVGLGAANGPVAQLGAAQAADVGVACAWLSVWGCWEEVRKCV